jgi:non-ribosomal peptide synthetase component F/thioesterase domain-containing protein/acyl carrier protein
MSKPANKLFNAPPGSSPAGSAVPAGDEPAVAESAPERTEFPCSIAQERFWLLDRLDPGNASYNVAVRWRLEGRVATDLLERSWLKIIERHEILRTTFHEVDGAPIQRVAPKAQFRLNEIDLSTLSPEQRQPEGDRTGVLEARAPFDLASGPLIRVTLLRFSPTTSIILVTSHQIACDGWSIGVMAREMGTIYQALRHDQPVPLEPLAIQYADYSLWHLEWLRVRGTEAETTYWTKQLAGVKPFKVIPDRLRPTVPTTNGAIVSRLYPRDLTNRAQVLTAERGATMFAAALAALCATLARFTGESDIVVGTQVSDRDQVELEPMIGQFVNSLVLRNDLGGDPSFGDLIVRIRDTVALALENRHIPIERLLGMIKGERNSANSPPISVNFIFQKTFIQNANYGDFDLIDMPSLPAGAIYDLNFFMVERPDGWRFSCQFNTDQFESATAERLLLYVQNTLESGVADPSRRVSGLELCKPGEARLLLDKLNDTRTLYPRDLSLSKLIEVQAQGAPDAIAVTCGERQLTYAELNASADRVAGYLRAHGVAAGAKVGICLRPSVEWPLCVLAVVKAGAAFLVLDPADPPARHAEGIAAAGLTAVIGRDYRLPVGSAAAVRSIEIEDALAAGVSDSAAPANAAQDAASAACYLITPGTREAAAVVGLSHRGIANVVYSLAKRPGIGSRDVVVSASPPATDRAVIELFAPLLLGARVVVAGERELGNGRSLLTLLQKSGATLMYGAAHTWRALLEAGWVGYPALKMLCCAPDLPLGMLDQLAGMSGELWALYGHPEATVWSAVHRLKPKQPAAIVGSPIANTSLYVFDEKRQVAPVGATGELMIGGDGLADRPGSKAGEIPGASPGMPLYSTGDLARLRADGQIEYLGRSDARFMHSGRSFDPAETERVLLRHAEISDAIVVPAAGADGSPTAYAVPRSPRTDGYAALIESLRAHMANNLPHHLVPAAVVVRETLPRLANGSVDRTALRAAKTPVVRGASSGQPSGDVERRLAELWKTMLGIDSVDPADNFFELGGHSLLAARMLTRVEREFGRRIKLATLFLAPTLHDFAKILQQTDLREFDFRQVVKIQPHGSKRPLIAINNTGIYYGLAKSLGPEQPVYSLQLFDPSVRDSALPTSLEEIAAGYVGLIRRVQPQGPYDLIGWCVAGALAFEIARQLLAQKQAVSRLFLIDSWLPNYFESLPAWRRIVGEWTMRAQLVMADLRRVLSSDRSLWEFVTRRTLFMRLQRLFRGSGANRRAVVESDEQATPETYDQWLLAYLQLVTNRYTPQPYDGAVTLLRSRLEPTGWFFQEHAGWGAFVKPGIHVRFVDGDHFTMFQEPGCSQMAAHIAADLVLGEQIPAGSLSE